MVPDRSSNVSKIVARRQKVAAEMAREQSVGEIDSPVGDEEPGEEKMPPTPQGEPLSARDRRPGRKRADVVVVCPRHAEYPGRDKAMAADRGNARRAPLSIFGRTDREKGMV